MKTLDVVAAILERDGKILLAQRPAHADQQLVWCLPEEALTYPLAPADIPLLQAFILLRDARPAD
ncbi:hypothetical protein HV211_12245 [Citrobacter freundii]|uniref:hypothetical protein n=1 Tax=Citrobacter freundii TaxID=546 RepID=UPI0015EAE3D6|nr:hypothetical protein [Citrobacter freundii]QLY63182.1 hypothetical protein HV211_12245 [Citrobacter freundii]